jgi:hypothetical protein
MPLKEVAPHFLPYLLIFLTLFCIQRKHNNGNYLTLLAQTVAGQESNIKKPPTIVEAEA